MQGVHRVVVGALVALTLVGMGRGAHAEPTEGRGWLYANMVAVLSPNWAINAMPGIRYEFHDSETDAGDIVMYEFFTGPIYMTRFGPVKFKLPFWYYYMGFPIKAKDDYFYSHNLELVPMFEYSVGQWTFLSRSIFHNKVYADNAKFTTDSQRRGYSLLWRQLLRATYHVTPEFGLTLADEVFIGLVEDGETNEIAKGEPFFEKHGFSMNRLYAGLDYVFAPGLSVSPQYILETHHDPDHGADLTRIRHYMFVTFTYALKTF